MLSLLPPLSFIKRVGDNDEVAEVIIDDSTESTIEFKEFGYLSDIPSKFNTNIKSPLHKISEDAGERQNSRTGSRTKSSSSGYRANSSNGVGGMVPVVMNRIPSVSAASAVSLRVKSISSIDGTKNPISQSGPSIIFERVSYCVSSIGKVKKSFLKVRNMLCAEKILESPIDKYDSKSNSSSTEGKFVLQNASGSCPAGRLTCIMGQSQSGKSTLLYVLSGGPISTGSALSGSIKYNDGSITEYLSGPNSVENRICYICPTDDHLSELTVGMYFMVHDLYTTLI